MRKDNNADKNKQEQPKIHRGGFRRRKLFSRLTLLTIALVIGLSSVVTVFIPQSANAVTTSESKKTDPDWQIRSLILYRALGDCLENANFQRNIWNGEVEVGNVRSGSWFNQFGVVKPAVGPYFRGDVDDNNDADVRAPCQNSNDIVNRAMTLWGFDKENFFCDIGGKRVSGREGKDCYTNSGATGNFNTDDISIDRYRKFVQKTVYGKEGVEPALSKETYWYSFYLKVFLKSCAYKRTALTNPEDISALDITSDTTSGYKIKVAQADGTTKDTYYSGGLERTHDIATRPAGIEGNVSSASVNAHCGNGGAIQIEERINHYAPAAALLMKSGEIPVTQTSDADLEGGQEGSSCSVEGGLGWLLCPLANLAAGLTDSLFVAVSAFLRVAPVNLSPNDNPLYSAWATMRTIANVAFVIVFLIIIFSQLSSLGITNYGVKKMLPRLVIAAILVNLSFYICAIAVDVSNIVGVSLQDVFTYISQQTTDSVISETDNWGSITTAVLSGSGALLAAGAFASVLTSGGLLAALAGVLPLLFGALFALIVAFLVLLARQALIIMAIVVAPLAFVAYLLPNTESWFKKWRDLFITLLALFPMMSIVFGGSQLAAVILRESSASTLDGGEDMIAFFLYVGSFAVQAIPFFITPVLIKLSSGVLGRFAGLVNNPNKGPIDAAKKWAQGKADNAQNRGYQNKLRNGGPMAWSARRRAKREAIHSSLESEAKRAETEFVADKTKADSKFQKSMSGISSRAPKKSIDASKERIKSRAIDTSLQMRADEVKAGDSILEDMNLSGRQRTDLALGRTITHNGKEFKASETLQKAAIVRQMATGSLAERKELIEASQPNFVPKDQNGNPIPGAKQGETYEFRQLVADGAAKSGSLAENDPALTGRRIDKITQGEFTYDDAVMEAFQEGKYNSQAIAKMHNDARQELLRVAQNQAASGNPLMLASLNTAIEGIESSPEIQGSIAGNTTGLEQLATIKQDHAYQTYADAGNIQGVAPSAPAPIPTAPPPATPAAPAPTPAPTPTPPNFFADQQPAAPAPTPPANNDPTSLGYWQSPPPIPEDPMKNRQTPPTTPDPDEYHDGMSR